MAVAANKRHERCPQCGIEFLWRYGLMRQRRGCCSDECAAVQELERAKKRRRLGYRSPSRIPKKSMPPTPCEWCGTPTTRPKLCSAVCADRKRRGYHPPPREKVCEECGEHFSSDLPAKFCGRVCRDKSRWRAATTIRRARLASVARERFDPFEIFERDGWKCHLCGVKTPKKQRGTLADTAPELDHIIPLASGGGHTRKNTACACRKCNRMKSDKLIGQLRLIG